MKPIRFGLASTVALVAVLTFSMGTSVSGKVAPGGVHAAADWAPKAPPAQYDPKAGPNAVKSRTFITDVCATADQLDCVESIAAYLNGAWVEGAPTETFDANQRIWTIAGLVNLDGNNRVAVVHQINYTGNIFLTTEIRSAAGNGDRDATGVQRNVKFRATIRTSWVLPTHIGGTVTDAKITVTKLAISGASKVTMEGVPTVGMVISDDSQLTSETGKGDYETREFSVGISDGRFYPIKQECIEKPTIMTADNGHGFSLPTFDKGNLDLKLTSPHFLSDGVSVHYGVYEAVIPLETAKCLWGDSITTASEFKVEVVETNGGTKTATRTVNVTTDGVSIKASGFTYSSPTIRVSYVAPVVATTTTTTTTSPATTTTTTPAAVPVAVSKPAKPTGLTTKISKGVLTVSFTKVSGVSYAVTAVKGKTKKTLRCASSAAKLTCTARSLARGTWKVSVVPSNSSGTGTAATKSVRIP